MYVRHTNVADLGENDDDDEDGNGVHKEKDGKVFYLNNT